MTTLTTIIEEETTEHRCDCEDQPCHVMNITVDKFAAAMHRAYKAGEEAGEERVQKALAVQAIEIREEEANEYNKIIEKEVRKAREEEREKIGRAITNIISTCEQPDHALFYIQQYFGSDQAELDHNNN